MSGINHALSWSQAGRALLAGFAILIAAAAAPRAETGKLQVVESVELSAAPAEVWRVVGAFDRLQDWHPAVESSTVQGDPDEPGATRRLMLAGGGEIKEELLNHSDERMRLNYRILESPLPVADYESFLGVTATEDGGTLVIWGSRFNPFGASDAEARKVITGVYRAGLDNLKDRFGG